MRQFVLPGRISGEDIQSRIVVEGDNEGAMQPTSSFDEVSWTVGSRDRCREVCRLIHESELWSYA